MTPPPLRFLHAPAALSLLAGAIAIAGGCATPTAVRTSLTDAEATITRVQSLHGEVCAPAELAHAEAQARFARLEGRQGDVMRARGHASEALDSAKRALTQTEVCGAADRDADGLADVVDSCPDEAEDRDGIRDADGCRDLDATGDEDKDGIWNIDDGLNPDLDADGLGALFDFCPSEAEDVDGWDDEDGCPDTDDDQDGLPDATDRCPSEPGDRLHGGCPALDADHDGVADARDRCPQAAEAMNRYRDDDGCPDAAPKGIVTSRKAFSPAPPIAFTFASATLLPESLPVLGEIVRILEENPQMRLAVEGHTDNDGEPTFLYALSRERADSVRAYIESRGIAPERLAVVGFGATRPIDTNTTPEGRARNRRVVFTILDGAAR